MGMTRRVADPSAGRHRRLLRWLAQVGLAFGLLTALVFGPTPAAAAADAAFTQWLEALWPHASAKGVTRPTFDAAFVGVEPDLSLPDLVIPGRPQKEQKGQAEFTKTPAQYLDEAYLTKLAVQGKALLAQHDATLAAIEKQQGVSRYVLLALWGRETAFGTYKLPHYAIKALATEAYLGRRKDMFRTELLFALKMLEDKLATREQMKSSWAGAMGLTQFMPSEFYEYAVDFDGDGKADIFNSVPDALASAAVQLVKKGWQRDKTWGFEIATPATIDCTFEGPDLSRPVKEWTKLGVKRVVAAAMPDRWPDQSYLLMPAGAQGPGYLALDNFKVLRAYNPSDLYALFVGTLAYRIAGSNPQVRAWQPIPILSTAEIEDLQQRLQSRGYDIGTKPDGKIGTKTRVAVGRYQKSAGLGLDCWPNAVTLVHLQQSKAGPGVATR